MTQKVNVPDPVHKRLKREADERDVSMGTIVEEWMQSHDNLQRLLDSDFKNFIETRGGDDE